MKTSKRYVSAQELKDRMEKKLVFYCSPSATRGKSREIKDLILLKSMRFEVISSNTNYLCQQIEELVAIGEPPVVAFDLVYSKVIKLCSMFILRAETNGKISELTLRFIKLAKREGIPIMELPREFRNRMKKNAFFNSQ